MSNCYGKNIYKFLNRQDTFGTLVHHRLVTAYFNVQQNCLELQKLVYLVISFVQFIPTSPSSCYQAGGLTKACERLVGPRRSAQEIKKGHRSVSHNHSVVLPTRVLAQSLSHMNAIGYATVFAI